MQGPRWLGVLLPPLLFVSFVLASGACREQSEAQGAGAESAADTASRAGSAEEASEAGSASGPLAADPARQAQRSRLEAYFDTVAERARQGCAGFAEDEPASEASCRAALEDVYRDVGRRIETSPASWETRILGIARSCLREANDRSKTEGTGEGPGTLFVSALADVRGCLDRQVARLADQPDSASGLPPNR